MKKPAFFNRSELTATLWAFRQEFLIVGILSFLTNLLMLAPTLYMLQVFDRVMSSQSELTLLAVSLITLFLFGVMACSEWLRSRVLVRAGMRFDEQLSTRVFNASFEAYLSQSSSTPSRAFGDLIQIRQFLTGRGIFALFDAPWAPIYIAVTFFLHPWLGILSLVFAVVQAALAWFGHRHTVAPAEEAAQAGSETTSYLQSKLRNAEVLESMGMIGNLQQRWNQRYQVWMNKNSSALGLTHRVTAWSKFIRYTQQSLSLGAGALLVIDGQLSPGAMIAANVLMGRALAPIDQLVSTWRGFVSTRSAFERLEKLLLEYPERDPALTRVAPTGEIGLRGVVASAEGRTTPILKNISFVVPAGTVVAVLGPSGSGKSTLARAMIGIWPDVAGEVLLDGMPLERWNRIELGPHLGYLPQDVELFEGSIAENIARLGEVDSVKVIEAARSAGMHEMILRFPKGYDTPIGEAGNLLSGGQRQRIGLARAIYGDPSLIVLDEPNANLDDAGETALLRTVLELKAKGKTVFLITHRPGAVAVADRLMILRDGEIFADGPKEAVLASLRPASPPPASTAPMPPEPTIESALPA
ncbi:ATP-binding cassette, subfamily C, exporter for protease/lipase [Polaromonas sp. OV174]|uniref:type I secretion system permease/ATPase n=1 Tax=Polaromonas sp. OV174 TaxID=1855300 RepID=UPI0008ECB7A8|nr:type I secretion system permease/ATPase [Polaromonas sp. OV174]SFC17083.1 ATP-binding cassette, subfamily C, exporter for protease/lipase [Polaromonas sp. OV174]